MEELDRLVECSEQDEERFLWPEDWISEVTSPTVYTRQKGEAKDCDLTPEEVLKRYWGYDAFRPLQRDIVQSALEGKDTLALLPTGGGKSICFQVPGLMLPGITLVVTPLISLMKDQVDHLRARGVKATAIHSGMHGQRITQAIENCIHGQYKFLYISPERLASSRFRQQLEHLNVSLLVVDECHCICQWGYDFRPSYLNILTLRELLPEVPILALTATATPDVAAEIRHTLRFGRDSQTFQKSFFRPNLSYSIRRTEDKERMILHILERVEGSAIVYCRNRNLCRQMAKYLQKEGISATFFHAGLTYTEREMRQNRWMQGEIRVMVATNAFGMGIDKPDVRCVIHLMMPSSLEEYFQEAGRAGRDGKKSYAVVLLSSTDKQQLLRRISDSFPPIDYIHDTYDALCTYLGIGESEGYEHSYDFEYDLFVRNFHMRPVQTRSAIEIMQLSGWLSYHEDDTRSRLMFIYTREQLYQSHVAHDHLLRGILRLYTGLFSDYVFVSELDIAQLTGYTVDDVYIMLTKLNRIGVLHYIPHKNTPRIHFHIRRENSRHLRIPHSAYQDRLERLRERIEATVSYITKQDVCRSRLLLHYFGEQSNVSCGHCDVCLERLPVGLRHYIVEDTAQQIEKLLAEEGCQHLTISQVCSTLSYAHSDIIKAVQYLTAERFDLSWTLVGNSIFRKETLPKE